ncbi:amidohydrolase family protein [Bradyrhizobium canariense]|uniref:amidohydrolase family protein n=1 Tax=Bradyrhizobium canariense TaxID=255045 RepID=UPI0014317E92|nr:amidohydrolase family protein [Bradyrhizobium canariense]
MITDTQVHLWEAHRPDRPWPADQIGKPSFVAVPGARPHRPEPLGADELIGMMDRTGIDRAVIVPPSPVGDSNDTALEAARRFPQRFAVMGRFNPEADHARESLETWLQQPGMLGIRMTFFKPVWARWLAPGIIDWFWSGCERLGIPIMALAPGLLSEIAVLAERYPGLTIILDHMARRSDLRDAECFADLDDLLALARLPNIAVKATALPCYTNESYPFANLTPYLKRTFEAFSAHRIMWGSDLTRLPCSYAECLDHMRRELDFLTDDDRALVLGGTAQALLRWPENRTPAMTKIKTTNEARHD